MDVRGHAKPALTDDSLLSSAVLLYTLRSILPIHAIDLYLQSVLSGGNPNVISINLEFNYLI